MPVTSPAPIVITRSPGADARRHVRLDVARGAGSTRRASAGACASTRVDDRLARHARDRRLAGAVDVHEHDAVGVAERPRRSPRRARRCGCSGAAGRRPRCARSPALRAPASVARDLGRMVRVVVDDGDAVRPRPRARSAGARRRTSPSASAAAAATSSPSAYADGERAGRVQRHVLARARAMRASTVAPSGQRDREAVAEAVRLERRRAARPRPRRGRT